MARAKKTPAERCSRKRIIVRKSPLGRSRAVVTIGRLAFPAAIGRCGVTASKREGDGATPRGRMRIESGFFRKDRITRPVSRLPLKPIRRETGWCDAPSHPRYNREIRLPFPASHERLMREDGLYDICLVLDWNRRSRRRNRGSAIFLHMVRPCHRPTEGCVAVGMAAMRRILACAGTDTDVLVL